MDNLTFSLLVDAALKGTLVLFAATVLAIVFRRGSAARRHLVWQMALLALLSLPLIKAFSPLELAVLPQLRSPIAEDAPAAVPIPAVDAAAPLAESGASPVEAGVASGAVMGDVATNGGSAEPLMLRMLRWFGYAWVVVSAALLLRLALGFVLVRWFALRAYPLYENGWSELNSELSHVMGLRGDVQLFASPHIATPMTWGVARPVIMLPSAAEDWTEERRRVVMLHELAHIRRRDSLTHMFAQVACAVYWFHPLVWKANARMRAEAERASDDLVLAAGTKPSVYADHLLELIRTIGNMRTPALALPMAQRSTFEGRLLAILEPHIDRTTPRPLSVVGMLMVVGLIVFPLAGLTTASAISTETGAERLGNRMPALHTLTSDDDVAAKMAENASIGMDMMPKLDIIKGNQTANVQQNAAQYALAPLVGALRDADVMVRLEAAQSLGQMEDTLAVAALSRALREDADPEVRKMAAWALGNIESSAAVPALSQALRSDRDPDVRRTAVWALGQIEDADALPALAEALKTNDVELRRQAVWALGQIEDARAVPALAGVLRDSDAQVREQAVWALGQIESPAAVAPLSAFINDANADVRKQVAWALGQIEDADAVPALSTLLRNDDEAEVRKTSAWALGQIESVSAVPALTTALKDRSAGVRSQAAWALGQIEQRPAAPALLEALKDSDSEVRATAAWALAQIEDPGAASALRAALKDSDPEVRQAVLNALVSLGDQLGYEALAEMLKDSDPEVRRAAAAAMGRRGGHPDPRPMPMPQPQPQPRPIR